MITHYIYNESVNILYLLLMFYEDVISSGDIIKISEFTWIDKNIVTEYFLKKHNSRDIKNKSNVIRFIDSIQLAKKWIYSIVNMQNWMTYIWKTNCLYKRKYFHLNRLRKWKHNISILQKDFNLYWEKAFRFNVVNSSDWIDIDKEEIMEILRHNPASIYNKEISIKANLESSFVYEMRKLLFNNL